MATKDKNSMHIAIPASVFTSKELCRYLMQVFVSLPNSTSFIKRFLLFK